MTATMVISTVFELLVGALFIVGLVNEDKLIKLENKYARAFIRGVRKLVKPRADEKRAEMKKAYEKRRRAQYDRYREKMYYDPKPVEPAEKPAFRRVA